MRPIPVEPCLALIHEFEQGPGGGFAATPYRDKSGNWTVGWGHKCAGPYGWNLDEAQADQQALLDLTSAAQAVCSALGPAVDPLTDNQYAALIDFTFNLGGGAFAGSTLCHLITIGNLTAAPDEFGKWVYERINGVETRMEGLVRRRAAEVAVWNA